ncbi:MAG: helix-hairpin-helix domain-containing protein [candidate division Zixibacteria bacterium]|nr:helix-hairpin-helix domain-containing protein [candidate division Zixibacteria bacterium]
MNRYFDFTQRQLKCLAVLAALAVVMAVYLFVRAYVDTVEAAPPLKVFVGEDNQQFTGTFVLDPNTAPVDSLELLPGIGPVLAERIIEYRRDRHFEREIDITEVKGIGPKLYEQIKPYLKIRKW